MNNTQDKEKLLQKIKSLLSLANDPSTTAHERNLAYQRAQFLMAGFAISEIDLNELAQAPDKLIVRKPLTVKPHGILKSDKLFIYIVTRTARNFGVFVYQQSNNLTGDVFLYGFDTNCTIADYVIASLFTQGWADYRRSFGTKTAGTCINFWRGFLEGLFEKFKPLSEVDSRAMQLYDRVNEEFKKSMTMRSIGSIGGSSTSGFQDGRLSALQASIRGGLTQTTKSTKQITKGDK